MKTSLSPEFARLFKKRVALISECKRTNKKANGRQKAQAADRAFDLNERAILTFKARSIQDVIAKLQIAGETLITRSPGAPEYDDEMGFRLAIEDLERLAA